MNYQVKMGFLALLGTTWMMPSMALSADGPSCSLEQARLVCASGKGSEVLDAMANEETIALLKRARAEKSAYSNGKERESYRRSLEANRKAAKRYADQAFRATRRRRMAQDDYEVIRAKFAKAMEAYHLGMNLYRDATWFSPVKPHQDQ